MFGNVQDQKLHGADTALNITVLMELDGGIEQEGEFGSDWWEFPGEGTKMGGWKELEPTELVMVTSGRPKKSKVVKQNCPKSRK